MNNIVNTIIKNGFHHLFIFLLIISCSSVLIANAKVYDFHNFLASFAVATIITIVIQRIGVKVSEKQTRNILVELIKANHGKVSINERKGSKYGFYITNWGVYCECSPARKNKIRVSFQVAQSEDNYVLTLPLLSLFEFQLDNHEQAAEMVMALRWLKYTKELERFQFIPIGLVSELQSEDNTQSLAFSKHKHKQIFEMVNARLNVSIACLPPVRLSSANDETKKFLGGMSIDHNKSIITVVANGVLRQQLPFTIDELTMEELLCLVLLPAELEVIGLSKKEAA
ncbi:hypothetical protein [Photobacterium leiognathi]|uniref:hypothetical protein n=1 Tax=Photobacterium leiognathi TaxID=553611 RepID=UPI00298275F0|nr:hypothetical protein [Photobacterium leiognathi]